MALSMDEQRVLAEIERRLAADDPGLATCLTSFRRPGPATVLRSPRARIIGSLFTVLLVTMVSLMVYAMIPFRTHTSRTPTEPTGNTTISAPTGQLQSATATKASASMSTGTGVSASAGAVSRSSGQPVTPSAGANAGPGSAQALRSQAGGHDTPAAPGP